MFFFGLKVWLFLLREKKKKLCIIHQTKQKTYRPDSPEKKLMKPNKQGQRWGWQWGGLDGGSQRSLDFSRILCEHGLAFTHSPTVDEKYQIGKRLRATTSSAYLVVPSEPSLRTEPVVSPPIPLRFTECPFVRSQCNSS